MFRGRVISIDASDDAGAVLPFVAVAMSVLVLIGAFVIDFGNWFEHKRHLQLQADAAALAGASLFNKCLADTAAGDTAITNEVQKYGGVASGSYNPQVKDASNVHLLINSQTYYGQASTPSPDRTPDTTTNTGGPCEAKMVDVRMTQVNLPFLFNNLIPGLNAVPNINAHARVEVHSVDTQSGSLPIGVPDVNPNFAFAQFVDETTGTPVLGCTVNGNPVTNCETQLTRTGTSSSGLGLWSDSASPPSVPITSSKIGVRIRLVGGSDSTAQCGQILVSCYDAGSSNGIVFVRGWTNLGVGSQPGPPIARDVQLFNGTCSDPYFSSLASSCTLGVHAKVDFGVPAPVATYGATVTASINGSPFLPLTFNALTGYWDSTGSNFFSIPPQAGPLTVDLKWDESIGTEGGNTCKIGNGNKCNGVFASVQRTFAALNSRSGPIQQAIVSENGSQWTNSFQIGTSHNLAVTIGVKGSLGDAASVGDPVVDLRVVGGSRTQSLDCQPNSNLRDEIRLGCAPTYSKNTGQPCPSNLWTTPQPWNCVLVQTGTSIGQVSQGMQDRILCGGQNCQGNPSCTAPNNWSQFPNLPAGDPRIIPVFLTPFGSFNDSGSGVVPVTNFAMFYVTGWGGNGGSSDPCPNADQVPTGDIAGHFIKYVDSLPKNQDGSQFCDFNAFGNCFTVLTR